MCNGFNFKIVILPATFLGNLMIPIFSLANFRLVLVNFYLASSTRIISVMRPTGLLLIIEWIDRRSVDQASLWKTNIILVAGNGPRSSYVLVLHAAIRTSKLYLNTTTIKRPFVRWLFSYYSHKLGCDRNINTFFIILYIPYLYLCK